MKKYAILVNTCDKFEDCWIPFFKLFKIYWPDYNGKIYLNTEYKDFSYSGLNIIPLKVAEKKQDADKITWSECLKRALEKIDEDILLYMQEDYFLKGSVKNDLVEKYSNLMNNAQNLHCIHLTDQSVKSAGGSKYENLDNVEMNQRYRISCQAALWQKDILASYLRSYESAWDFEEFGSKRSSKMKHNFYVVNRNWVKLGEYEIIPYIFTGIVQGRWKEEVVDLFEKHDISVDYAVRGFLSERVEKPFHKKVQYRFNKIPNQIKNELELLKLKNR